MSDPIFRDVTRPEEVRLEAQRCGGCNQECMTCNVGIEIPKLMDLLKDGYFEEAGKLLAEQNPFASTCGRICAAPCQTKCPQNINIKAIEKFLGDQYVAEVQKGKKNKRKVAIVGAGTAGLTVSEEFLKKGYEVSVYEATPTPGGFVQHFVSEQRFPSKIKKRNVDRVLSEVKFIPNTIVGASPKVNELAEQFDAVVLATGANAPSALQVEGEHLKNIYTAAEYIRGAAPSTKVRTIVVGGDHVALDCARLAAKKGDKVTLIDRHAQQSLKLDHATLSSAQDEGIRFMLLTQPVRFLGEKKVTGIECMQMMVTQSDFDDSWITVPIEDSQFPIECDRVIIAIGFDPNPSIGNLCSDLRCVGKGRLWTDENHMTTIPGVFAAGSSSPHKTIEHARRVVEKIDTLLNEPASTDAILEAMRNG
ncbi:MAG: FAD-dependent oxidoreductase [Candidatus Nanoarchaeia archaeon]